MIFSVFQIKKMKKRRRFSSVIIVRNVTWYLKMMTKKHWFNPVAWKLFERQLFLILAQLGGGILKNSTCGPGNVSKSKDTGIFINFSIRRVILERNTHNWVKITVSCQILVYLYMKKYEKKLIQFYKNGLTH